MEASGKPRQTEPQAPRPTGASRGVRVTSVTSSSGRPATSIDVDVEPETVQENIQGKFTDIRSVVARVPHNRKEEVDWQDEHLSKVSERKAEPGKKGSVRYSGTLYGATDAKRLGVGVRVETDAGNLDADAEGESLAHDADKPPDGSR